MGFHPPPQPHAFSFECVPCLLETVEMDVLFNLQSSWSQRVGHHWATKLQQQMYNYISKVKVAQRSPSLCDPMDYTVRGILQARILEWVVFPFSRRCSQPRDWTQASCIAGSLPTELSGNFLSNSLWEKGENHSSEVCIRMFVSLRQRISYHRHTIWSSLHPWHWAIRTVSQWTSSPFKENADRLFSYLVTRLLSHFRFL